MLLTEQQKIILFYALAAVQRTLYLDDEQNTIDYNYNNFRLDVPELLTATNDYNELMQLIDKTLDQLCY